jgi:hypothetical protein
MTEKMSRINPLTSNIRIGQDLLICKGFLKGNIVKICSLPSNKRVSILLNFLATTRKAIIPADDLT